MVIVCEVGEGEEVVDVVKTESGVGLEGYIPLLDDERMGGIQPRVQTVQTRIVDHHQRVSDEGKRFDCQTKGDIYLYIKVFVNGIYV